MVFQQFGGINGIVFYASDIFVSAGQLSTLISLDLKLEQIHDILFQFCSDLRNHVFSQLCCLDSSRSDSPDLRTLTMCL